MRIIYFGMPCTFSLAPLRALLRTEHEIVGVIVPAHVEHCGEAVDPIRVLKPPAQPSFLPLVNPYLSPGLVQLAWEHALPVWEVGQLTASASLATIEALQPDLAVVACFSRRIAPPLLRLPRLGFLNLHPSLLPAYRGPAPLFWTFRDGVRTTGVTLHLMDEHLDTGPIAMQSLVILPNGCSSQQADHLCSTAAGKLLIPAIEGLNRGTLSSYRQADGSTYAPWPHSKDFVLSPCWSAQHAYNFICGTLEWQQLYPLKVGDQRLYLQSAVSYTPDEVLGVPIVRQGSEVRIQFVPGVLQAELASSAP